MLSYSLERIRIENHFYSMLIEWISQLLNTLPFWLSPNSYQEFLDFKKTAISGHENCEKLIASVQHEYTNQDIKDAISLCQQRVQERKLLSLQVTGSLERMLKQLKAEREDIYLLCRNSIELIEKIQGILDAAQFGDMAWKTDYLALQPAFEKQRNDFFEQLTDTRQECLKNISLTEIQKDSFAADHGLEEDFKWLKYSQGRIAAWEKLFSQQNKILDGIELQDLFAIDCLTKNDYGDVLFLLAIISPEYLKDSLEQKLELYWEIIQLLQRQGEQIRDHWGEKSQAILRIFRTIRVYQAWEKAMNEALNRVDSPDWASLFTLYRLFTYEKKAFFTAALEKENMIIIFQDLTSLMAERSKFKDPQKMLNYFTREKQLIKNELENKKNALMEKYQIWEKMMACLGLSFTEQASFKLGMLGFDMSFNSMNHLETINPEKAEAIGNKINNTGNRLVPVQIKALLNPDRDVKIMQYLTGFFCFFADQGVSSWLGYSYRLITAINHALFSQFDLWVSLGEKTGFDEISLLEYEAALRWLSGLGISFLIEGRDTIVPTFLGYSAATAAAEISLVIVDRLVRHGSYSKLYPNAITVGKFAVQAGVYSVVYGSIFKKGLEFFPPSTEENKARDQALKSMGFFEQPNKEELQKRYRELARQYHPDKCMPKCKQESPLDISACIDSCLTNDQPIREINQAYSILKSSIQESSRIKIG